MIQLPSQLANILAQNRLHLTTLWAITKRDGVTLRFTERDEPIEFEGETYEPAFGVESSARQLQEGLKTRNLEARGIIDSLHISTDDLRAGRYREAEVVETVVDARYPWAGSVYMARYWISETTFDGLLWTAQVQDVSRWLRVATGDVIGRNCRWDLGDARCQVSMAPFTYEGQELSHTGDVNSRLQFRVLGLPSLADDFFKYGTVEWGVGADNHHFVGEIAAYDGATKTITLRLEAPFPFTHGDEVTVRAGCDKTIDTCKTKFSNFVNFGGFPHIPGTEKMLTTPNAV